jgi:hypothetical protein
MTLTCDNECGRADWAGRQIVVTFNDVLLLSSLLFGHVAGKDLFDRHNDNLSPDVIENLGTLTAFGIPQPRIHLRIAMHSGSELQLACGSITLEVISPRSA